KEAADKDKDHDPAFAEASSEKPGILPIPAQTHDKPRWTVFCRGEPVFVGCDQRSESNGRCAGAGNRWSLLPSGLLSELRAGTPQFTFGPLVTPYILNCSRRQNQAAFSVGASNVERTQAASFGCPRPFCDEQSILGNANDAE
ncbi:MAG: hypothetical protein ACI92S_004605, partial [Planctomycetaceae bacterium]